MIELRLLRIAKVMGEVISFTVGYGIEQKEFTSQQLIYAIKSGQVSIDGLKLKGKYKDKISIAYEYFKIPRNKDGIFYIEQASYRRKNIDPFEISKTNKKLTKSQKIDNINKKLLKLYSIEPKTVDLKDRIIKLKRELMELNKDSTISTNLSTHLYDYDTSGDIVIGKKL